MKHRVLVNLNKENIIKPNEKEIGQILLAADNIIGMGGRNLLVKILKGSKDQAILKHGLQDVAQYGAFNSKTSADIAKNVDWMILNYYLEITYSGRLPVICFDEKGWEVFKPMYAHGLISKMLAAESDDYDEMVTELHLTNREVVILILEKIAGDKINGTEMLLNAWEKRAYKKVAVKIRWAVRELNK